MRLVFDLREDRVKLLSLPVSIIACVESGNAALLSRLYALADIPWRHSMTTRPYPSETVDSPFTTMNIVRAAVAAKKQILAELIEGHLTLIEAVARFEAVKCDTTTEILRTLGVTPPENTLSRCRAVIGWVQLVLSDRPEQAEAVSERLEVELQQHVNCHGRILLPALGT